ncbi:MAG: DUF1573 domain-containing protein [Bacteroidetes bacterium]|nr:DUF1573 domain-containing protein [Bacteroidota bacterium]
MKYATTSLLFVLFALMFTATGQAQTDEGQSDVATQQCFGIVGTSDYYFGEIDQNETVEHTFIFKNTCEETIEIGSARASCGCTAAVVSEKVIPPGGEAQIQVKFTPPRGTRGKVTKTVSLYLKDDQKPHTIIRFSAKIKTDLDIQPQYIQLLGAEVGKTIQGKATVKNISEKELTIEGISINVTSYADTAGDGRTIAIPLEGAVVTPAKLVLAPGQSGDITVTLVPQHPGQVNGAIRLQAGTNEGIIQVFGVVRDSVGNSLRRAAPEAGEVQLDGTK